MSDVEKIIYTIFGGVIVIAIWSVIVGRGSQAPAVIQASSTALANIIASAVSPVHTQDTNGLPNLSTFSQSLQMTRPQ